jgi:hypothetical protein
MVFNRTPQEQLSLVGIIPTVMAIFEASFKTAHHAPTLSDDRLSVSVTSSSSESEEEEDSHYGAGTGKGTTCLTFMIFEYYYLDNII